MPQGGSKKQKDSQIPGGLYGNSDLPNAYHSKKSFHQAVGKPKIDFKT